MATENLSQKELAHRLNRTTRQIQKLGEKGLPRNPDGTYPWPEAHEWWVKFKQEEKDRRAGTATTAAASELDKARAAKEWALAGMRQLDLELQLGRLVTLDYMESQLEASLVAVRTVLNNAPGKYAPRLVGCDTVGRAQVLLQEVIDEVLRALTEAEATIPDNDDGDDSPDGKRELAA